jgi:hypothetical protein
LEVIAKTAYGRMSEANKRVIEQGQKTLSARMAKAGISGDIRQSVMEVFTRDVLQGSLDRGTGTSINAWMQGDMVRALADAKSRQKLVQTETAAVRSPYQRRQRDRTREPVTIRVVVDSPTHVPDAIRRGVAEGVSSQVPAIAGDVEDTESDWGDDV